MENQLPRALRAAALLGCALSLHCGSDTGADPAATAVPVDDDGTTIVADKAGITAYLQAGTYLKWEGEAAVHDSVRSHGGSVRTYFNNKYLFARRTGSYPMAVGSMAVKELYSSGSVSGYAVGVKTRAGTTADTWTWYETTGLPDVQYFGVANPTCEGCHSADSGHDRSLTPSVPVATR